MTSQDQQISASANTPRAAPALLRWLEVVLITGLVLGLGAWNRPEDPFYIDHSFPWPALAPLLIGLRYGFFMALASGVVILASLGLYLQTENLGVRGFPWVWGIGVLALGLIAGEFRDYWGRRLEKLEASNHYRSQRLEEFTRNFYLLKVSHDRIEQQLAGSSGSLREALRRLYDEVALTSQPGLDHEGADLMLQLLARYGQLQIAAIYAVTGGQVSDQPLAKLGDYRPISGTDPLLVHALQERSLVSVQTEFRKQLATLDTDLLVAIPFIDATGRLVAMCAVQAIPFFSFQVKTLRLLAIMAGHMADILLQQQTIPGHPDQEWRNLRFQIKRAADDAERFGLPAMLVAFEPEPAFTALLIDRMHRMRRGLDVIGASQNLVVILMPLTDELGSAGYLQRLDDDIRQSSGRTLSDIAKRHSHLSRNLTDTEDWLNQRLNVGVAGD